MRVTIFDDNGNELAQAAVHDLNLDGRTRRVDISATIMPQWRPLPEGGHSAKSVMNTLMDYLVASGKAAISYSRPIDVYNSVRSTGLG